MKPVYQTIIDSKEGDCFSACLASVLEIPLVNIPNFLKRYGQKHMLEQAKYWLLENFGLTLIIVDVTGPRASLTIHPISRETVFLVSGKSKTFSEGHHVVVAKAAGDMNSYKIIHDPNPKNLGIDGDPLCYYFFTAVDPARTIRRVKGVL